MQVLKLGHFLGKSLHISGLCRSNAGSKSMPLTCHLELELLAIGLPEKQGPDIREARQRLT